MLVYSGTVWLSKEAEIDCGLRVVAEWLSRKTHSSIPLEFLRASNFKKTSDGMQIVVSRTHSENPFLECVRLTHGDKEVRGRQWITEIGIKREHSTSEIECSILLKTEEISTRVEGKIQPTVPFVVHELLKHCPLSPNTIGLSTASLDNWSDTEAFGYLINQPDRHHPLVFVSPSPSGEYLINVEQLRFFLEGIAEIVLIPVGANTFKMGEMLGSQYIVWGGGINIIFPEVHLYGSRFCPTKRLTPDAINAIENENDNREREILSIVTHRVNLPNSWRHISLDKVNEQIQKDERKRLREQAIQTGKTNDYVDFLEGYVAEIEQKMSTAENRANENETMFLEVDDENRQLKYEIEGLKLSLSHIPQSKSVDIPDYIGRLLDTTSKYMTPKESLMVISSLFSERLVVLDSAFKSADDSDEFKEKKQAFQLLWKLSNEYWMALADGKGDVEARQVFGKNEYASNEGETAGSNKRAKSARTFEYKGKSIEMMKHVKHGVKDSASETIRIHFDWDAEDKKIVIGYCGPHLPHK